MTANATNNTKNKGFLAVAALGYFVLGMIGTSFAIAPGYASPVFPAAGFAVACLLLLMPAAGSVSTEPKGKADLI